MLLEHIYKNDLTAWILIETDSWTFFSSNQHLRQKNLILTWNDVFLKENSTSFSYQHISDKRALDLLYWDTASNLKGNNTLTQKYWNTIRSNRKVLVMMSTIGKFKSQWMFSVPKNWKFQHSLKHWIKLTST